MASGLLGLEIVITVMLLGPNPDPVALLGREHIVRLTFHSLAALLSNEADTELVVVTPCTIMSTFPECTPTTDFLSYQRG
jgi:hypothetical protein